MAAESRRLRRVPITPEFLIDIMKHGTDGVEIVENPLPEDARFVGSSFDPFSLTSLLFVSSESFDEVTENAQVPEHPRTLFRKVYPDGR